MMLGFLFLVVVLQLLPTQFLIVSSAALKPIIVVHIKGGYVDKQLQTAMKDIYYVNWVIADGNLNASILSGVKMVMLMRTDEPTNYTSEELDAIGNWYNQGKRTIWVGGDCDCGTDQDRLAIANSVLQKIGSTLRIESCTVFDLNSSSEYPAALLGVSKYCDKEFDFIVNGVNKVFFQGAGAIIGYQNQSYFSLEWPKPRNIYRIITTTDNGRIVDDAPPKPEFHRHNDKGRFVLMAIEINKEKNNCVIVSGDRPFSNKGLGMYKPELHEPIYYNEYPQQGALLFENLIKYSINSHPVAKANGPYSGEVGSPVFFNSSGSSDIDGTISKYEWDFGDGRGRSYAPYPNYTYLKPGTYQVTLTVVDDLGKFDSTSTVCTVLPKPTKDDSILTSLMEKAPTLITIGGAVVGVVGWVIRSRGQKKRKDVLFMELLDGIDSVYTRFKMNATNCEAELYKIKTQILTEFKQGMLDEKNFNILNDRIEKYMKEIRDETS